MTSARISTILSATILAIGFALPANAQSTTGDLPVYVTVIESCVLAIGADVDFGTYDPTSLTADDDGVGRLDLTCTQGTVANIALDNGANGARLMSDGAGQTLDYELFSDLGRTAVWGTVTPVAAPSNATRQFSVYGRIAAGQNVTAMPFDDSVVVTVTW